MNPCIRSNRHLRRLSLLFSVALFAASPSSAKIVEIPFDADNFSDPLDIDNVYFPLMPVETHIYKAETADGCEVSHVTVTNNTKGITIGGEVVTTRVVQDLEYEDEDCDGVDGSELVEKTSDWYAQDDAGNIWYFGEETFDCEGEGNCTLGEGAWEAGVNGALPGIIMLAEPRSGLSYRQEFAEDVAEDWGMVMNLNGKPRLRNDDAFPPGEWDNCLVTKEWNDLEKGHIEQKTYCPDVGLVAIDEHHGKIVRFELTAPASATSAADPFEFRKVPGE